MFGFFNVNKPAGITSRDVVNRFQRLLRKTKFGHAGTLDPLATGVLVVASGPATRLIEHVQQMPKRYLATFLLGRTSDTEDVEGEVVELVNPPTPSQDEIVTACAQFVGPIQQIPPAYSAVKVKGKRAYELARQGKPVDLKPREVVIHSIDLLEYEYPTLVLDIKCGSGTYVRSLGRDLAETLGTGAVMSNLVRTEIGCFSVETACELDQLTAGNLADALVAPNTALAHLPEVTVHDDQLAALQVGRPILLPAGSNFSPDERIRAVDAESRLLAIVTPRDDELRPVVNFSAR